MGTSTVENQGDRIGKEGELVDLVPEFRDVLFEAAALDLHDLECLEYDHVRDHKQA